MVNRIRTERERISADLPVSILERVDEHAARLGLSRNGALATLLDEALTGHEVNGAARRVAVRARVRGREIPDA